MGLSSDGYIYKRLGHSNPEDRIRIQYSTQEKKNDWTLLSENSLANTNHSSSSSDPLIEVRRRTLESNSEIPTLDVLETVEEKKLRRKRKRTPSKWKRNVQRALRMGATAYKTQKGRLKGAKTIEEVGKPYYTQKLRTFNFTGYILGKAQAHNFVRHEGVGNKGSSEIVTCLWKLLTSLGYEVKEVTFYAGTASGQNRNCINAAMFLRAVHLLPIEIINQKYIESGHSEMECDRVHSAI
nr:unnamed protein product [Callosobruchus analis]